MPEHDHPDLHDAREPEEREERRLVRGLDELVEASGIRAERLQVLGEDRVLLPHLGTTVSTYKVLDRESGRSLRLALDERRRSVDPDELLRKEQVLARDHYGNLQPALHETMRQRLEAGDDDATVPVLIKYAVEEEEEPFDKRRLEETDDDGLERLRERAEQLVRRDTARARQLHRELAREFDLRAADEGEREPSGPFVRTRLPLRALRELSRDERIAFIGLDDEEEIPDYPTIPESLPTTRSNTVQSTGVKGAGVRIAVLEGGTLTTSAGCFNIAATQDPGASPNSHMTKSVGIIGNRYSGGGCGGRWEGYAPDASVYLANASNYTDRYNWARSQGVNVVTMSWHYGSEETSGALHSRDVYFDYWVLRYPYPSVFTSAGNEAPSGAYSSGKGYNFFGVANVLNDGDGDRCDDVISSSSSWKNPTSPHADREVPEIAAPGSRHDLLGTDFGGTSCATPVAASIAALLMGKNASLKIWPEAIRAIMLATANYQQADGANWSKYSDGKDGTGMVNSLYGMWTAGRRESGTSAQFRAHDYGRMTPGDFSGGFFEKSWYARTVTTNAKIRIALTWNSKVSSFFGIPIGSVLDADLDLWVYDPDGNLVATSSTWDSNYEFIELTPSKIGNYRIRVRGYSVPSDFSSWYGVAWTTHYDLC